MNPPPIERAATGNKADWRVGGDRRSAIREAVSLMTALVRERIQTIAFVRTRLAAELVFKDCRDRLRKESRQLAKAVHAYRGGYLPEERREIERRLADGEIMGVASTNALELGIDIGSLDACARRVAEREQLDIEAARELVTTINRQRADYLEKLYGEGINDCSDYDLVLNTDRFDEEQAVGLILHSMQQAGYDFPTKLLQAV